MDDQKRSSRQQAPNIEPGRRYAAGRLRPRAGSDFYTAPVRSFTRSATVTVAKSASSHDATPITTGPSKTRQVTSAKPALPRTTKSLVLRRQMVEKAKEYKRKTKRTHRRHFVGYIIAAIIFISIGVIVWSFQEFLPFNVRFLQPSTTLTPVSEVVVPQESGTLDETEATKADLVAYKTEAAEPRMIRIPKLQLESRVRRVGVSLSSEPIAPSNIFDVGWFESSGKPGDSGAVLLNGHTVGPTKKGVFSDLKLLVPNDIIELERGDGTVIVYRVSRIQEYPVNEIDMSAATEPVDPTKQGLNLMTTANKYSKQAGPNDRRMIIFAVH